MKAMRTMIILHLVIIEKQMKLPDSINRNMFG